jgi:hypothetical protein
MKTLILTIFLFVAFATTALAQETTFSATEFNKKIGKTGTLCDTVYSLKIVNDTLTLLNMGGAFPNQKYTVAIIGNKITLDWTQLKGKPLCVTGVFELYKGRPEIEIADPLRINMKLPDKN